jgi:hypothetical protein
MFVVFAVFAGFLCFAAAVIWRMEYLRREPTSLKRLNGTVIYKRRVSERGEFALPFRGAGGPGIREVPETYLLTIRTADHTSPP